MFLIFTLNNIRSVIHHTFWQSNLSDLIYKINKPVFMPAYWDVGVSDYYKALQVTKPKTKQQ